MKRSNSAPALLLWAGPLLCLTFAVRPCTAWAAASTRSKTPTPADGVYNRFDGQLESSYRAGWLLGTGEDTGSALGLSGSWLYYSAIGVNLGVERGVHTAEADGPLASLGLEIKPLFLPRWALGHERGPAFWDLLLDSLSLGMGGFAGWSHGSLSRATGTWFSAGLGVPLGNAASGPWLEVQAIRRLPDPSRDDDAAPSTRFALYFSWHHFSNWLTDDS